MGAQGIDMNLRIAPLKVKDLEANLDEDPRKTTSRAKAQPPSIKRPTKSLDREKLRGTRLRCESYWMPVPWRGVIRVGGLSWPFEGWQTGDRFLDRVLAAKRRSLGGAASLLGGRKPPSSRNGPKARRGADSSSSHLIKKLSIRGLKTWVGGVR
jgi:hypothetical protein